MQDSTLAVLDRLCNSLSEVAGWVRQETNQVVATNDPVQIIKHFDKVRRTNELIKESRDALGKIEETLSREQVPDVMRAHGIKSTNIEGVGRVSLGTRWSASMPNKEMGFDWLRANEHGGVIQETVNAQTLGALAKELNSEGKELPAPVFTTNIMTYTSITKAK
jgi:hypothetical protein